MDNPLLKYSAKEYFFKAALCHFIVDELNAKVSGLGAVIPNFLHPSLIHLCRLRHVLACTGICMAVARTEARSAVASDWTYCEYVLLGFTVNTSPSSLPGFRSGMQKLK